MTGRLIEKDIPSITGKIQTSFHPIRIEHVA
jgi:hypothetical protein